MKFYYFSLFFVLCFFVSCNSQNNNMKSNYPKIGMSFSEFSEKYPEITQNSKDGNKQYQQKDTINNLPGKWTYEFQNNQLKWFIFESYSDEINKENFDKYLAATQKYIDNFKNKYAEPNEFEFENKNFKDPYKQVHWGYDVISAIWRTNKADIKIEFVFNGGKGMYNFIFSIEFHKSGYEFF